MRYYENEKYIDEIAEIAHGESVRTLKDRILVITGARGLIGSELIDTIMFGNQTMQLNCKIYAVVRNFEAAQARFGQYESSELFQLVQADINKDELVIKENIDYFIHGASNTHPLYYSTKPIETILTNTLGTHNTLKFAVEHHCKRYVFLSSVEVYGENRGDVEAFSEDYCGYINCNTLRAGYPEGKRAAEALCQAYRKEYGIEIVIPRLARCYGAGLLEEDSKALSQFIKKGLARENIVLKSEGKQYFSYLYVADAVDAILYILDYGEDGQNYNVLSKDSDIRLIDLASLIAQTCNTTVTYDLPTESEKTGYSKATRAIMNANKLNVMGWKSRIPIQEGIYRCIELVKNV